MSNSIWHTTDETPESCRNIAFYVDGYLYSDFYKPQYNQYGIFGASKVEKWCYMRELSSYILALENELEHTRKALDVAVDALGYYASENSWDETNRWMFVENGFEFAKDVLEQITALTKGGGND